jgi:hypothetical protein
MANTATILRLRGFILSHDGGCARTWAIFVNGE